MGSITVRDLPQDLHDKLRHMSVFEGKTIPSLVTEAVELYIEKYEKEGGTINVRCEQHEYRRT